jgi:hypothetical protein
MLFLHAGPPGSLEVTARAQGQFPIVKDAKNDLRVVRNASVGALVTATKPSVCSIDLQSVEALRRAHRTESRHCRRTAATSRFNYLPARW